MEVVVQPPIPLPVHAVAVTAQLGQPYIVTALGEPRGQRALTEVEAAVVSGEAVQKHNWRPTGSGLDRTDAPQVQLDAVFGPDHVPFGLRLRGLKMPPGPRTIEQGMQGVNHRIPGALVANNTSTGRAFVRIGQASGAILSQPLRSHMRRALQS